MAHLVQHTSEYLLPHTTLGTIGGLSDHTGYSDASDNTIIDTIENISEAYIETSIATLGDAGHDTYRGDMISDVNKGLGIVATGIKIISAILTILGGTTNRR